MNKNIKNYIKDSLYNRRIRRWDKPSVNIFIMPMNLGIRGLSNSESKKLIKKAVDSWNTASKGRVILNITDVKKDADVVVRWRQNVSLLCGVSDCDSVSNGRLRYMTMTLGVGTEFLSTPIDKKELYSVILHEFGHILGLGHSDDKEDVMNPFSSSAEPTERDMTVLKILYTFPVGMSEEDLFLRLENYVLPSSRKKSHDMISFLDILGKHNLLSGAGVPV